jgi:hypothetical protein
VLLGSSLFALFALVARVGMGSQVAQALLIRRTRQADFDMAGEYFGKY